MSFMMKRFAQAPRRAGSRPMGSRFVSCEILECRQLLSTGMHTRELARMIPGSASGRWESRWVETGSPAQSTGAMTQAVTNPAGASPSANVELGSGGTQSQSVSVGSAGSTAAATVTSSSMNTLPGGGKFVLAGAPMQIVNGGSTSSSAGSAVTSPAVSALPVGFNVGYGNGQGLVVSTANNGTTATVSSIGVPLGAIEVGPGGAPMVITSGGSAGSTAGSTFTRPAVSRLAGRLQCRLWQWTEPGREHGKQRNDGHCVVDWHSAGSSRGRSRRRTNGHHERRQCRLDHGLDVHKPSSERLAGCVQYRDRRRTEPVPKQGKQRCNGHNVDERHSAGSSRGRPRRRTNGDHERRQCRRNPGLDSRDVNDGRVDSVRRCRRTDAGGKCKRFPISHEQQLGLIGLAGIPPDAFHLSETTVKHDAPISPLTVGRDTFPSGIGIPNSVAAATATSDPADRLARLPGQCYSAVSVRRMAELTQAQPG